jgi:hypothetical protein
MGIEARSSATTAAAAPPVYDVLVVAPPPPYTAIGARVVNDAGHFAGTAAQGEDIVFIHWSPEAGVVALAPPAGRIIGIGAMDDFDNVALNTTAGPYLWSPAGGWRAVQRYPDLASAFVLSLNDRGQMVGFGFAGTGDRLDQTRRTLFWDADGQVRLRKPELVSIATAINEHRAVLATAFDYRRGFVAYEAFLAPQPAEFIGLGDLDGPDNGFRSTAVGLSEDGIAAINSEDPGFAFMDVACHWSAADGLRSLGLGPSTALGMSRRATMVGIVPETVHRGFYSFAWNPLWGTIDIADHLAPGAPGFDLLFATGISGNGTIAACGFAGGVQSAVVLAPRA